MYTIGKYDYYCRPLLCDGFKRIFTRTSRNVVVENINSWAALLRCRPGEEFNPEIPKFCREYQYFCHFDVNYPKSWFKLYNTYFKP